MRKAPLFLFCCLTSFYASAQTPRVDSLRAGLAEAADNRARLGYLEALLAESPSLSNDSLHAYLDSARRLCASTQDLYLLDFYRAVFLMREGYSDSSQAICDAYLSRLSYAADGINYTRFKLLQVDIISDPGNARDAIDSAFDFLREAEARGDTLLAIRLKARIGSIYSDLGQYRLGLQWLYNAQRTSLNPRYDAAKNGDALFFNIGLDYNYLGRYDSAEYYAGKTISESQASQDLTLYAYGLGLKAYVYSYTGRAALAEGPMKESVRLLRQIGMLYAVVNAMSALAKYYAGIGEPAKGVQTCMDALALLAQHPVASREVILTQLAACYKAAGDYRRYAETLNTLIAAKDSTYRHNSATELANLNARYNLSSKEAYIATQKLELLHKDIWISRVVVVTVLTLMATYLFFQRYRRRQATVFAEAREAERRRIAADLHDNLGVYASAISANVDEIRANASEPEELFASLKGYAGEIMSSLRDTIWALNKESVNLTGVSDRAKMLVQKVQRAYPQVSIQVVENIPQDRRLGSAAALHALRIIQEALHNALRHSHCTQVLVCFDSDGQGVSIRVEDNGCGFDVEALPRTGDGLSNIKYRAAEGGFGLAFERMEPRGTRLSLLFSKSAYAR